MNIPVEKNRHWISDLHKSIAGLDESQQAGLLKPCGRGCAVELLALCEKILGRSVATIEDLVEAWNIRREQRGLSGRWKFEPGGVRAVINECSCPLVTSGLIELHPSQCWCSQGMMETIFSKVACRPVRVELIETIGRGGTVCHFLARLS